MVGDGELHEGSNWEAAMSAAHYRLSHLTAIIDANKVSQSAHVANLVGIEPLPTNCAPLDGKSGRATATT